MDNADNNGRKRDIRERIVRAIQATEQAPNQQIPAEDLLRLKKGGHPPRRDIEGYSGSRGARAEECSRTTRSLTGGSADR